MKILQMVQTLDPSTGGVASAVTSLSKAMSDRGHDVEIVSLDETGVPWIKTTRLRVHALGAGRTSYRYSRELLPWLRENATRFDRVIVNGLWQYQSFAAWRALHGRNTPYYVFPHGMLDPWFKRTFPLKHAKKWLYWPWADYRVLRDATAVIFTSEEERIQARGSFWLYRCTERVSPLGVEKPAADTDAAREKFLAAFPALRGRRFLLFLGRLHPKKGCDLLVQAHAGISPPPADLSLVLAGPDQVGWKTELLLLAERLKIQSSVVFTGMIDGEVKRGALAAAEAFVLPSHQENFGLSVVEALAAGLPVLISNCVNIWREVEADQAGFVESDDVPGTTRLIKRWLDMPDEERETMRTCANQCFAARFEIGRAADSLLRVLEETHPAK